MGDQRARANSPRWVWWLFALSLPISAVPAVDAIVRWSSVPDRIATHFGFDGKPDGWTDKGAGMVVSLLIPVFLALMFIGIGIGIDRMTTTNPGTDPKVVSRQRRATVMGLAIMTVVMAGGLAAVFTAILHSASPRVMQRLNAGMLVLVLVTAVGMIVGLFLAGRGGSSTRTTSGEQWKGGIFYYDPDDPRLMVDKRTGMGVTVNFGNPIGRVIGVALSIMTITGIVVPLALVFVG